MTDHDHDRGAYTPPTDEPLAFDARTRQARRPMPMTLVASLVVLGVLVVAVVLFYQSGVRGANEAPHVVGEPVTALKTAPPEDAQPADEAAGLEVYADASPSSAATGPSFAPPPEEPMARPAPTATPAAPPPLRSVQSAPVTSPAAPASVPTRPIQVAQAEAAARVPAAPAAAAPVPAAAAPASAGGAMVQIGAFSSQAIADAQFAEVARAFSQASGRGKRVEPVERNGKTLYRTAFTGFASRAEAQAFCQALKGAGRDCLVK